MMSERVSTYRVIAIFRLLALGGCRDIGLFHQEVPASPAPTAIPLPSVTPTEMSTLRPTATATSEAMASIEQTVPTRIASPEDTINLPPGFGKSVFGQGEEIGSLQDFAAGWRREDGSTWGAPC